MAFFRALESRRPAAERLFVDPVADLFLSPPLRAAAALAAVPGLRRLVPAFLDWRIPGPRPSAAVRTRIIDDALRDALTDRVDQLVLLGAGYDTRPYRLAGLRDVEVFEVDHPATQAVKRSVLQRALGELPRHVRFVAIDFDRDDLGAGMAAAGLAPGQRTFTIWEGVAAYLTPAAVDATLSWASAVAGPGSRLLFTYVHEALLDGSRVFAHADAWVDAVRDAGEPFVFGLDPATLPAFLADRGWELREDLSTTEALANYGQRVARVPSFYRIAHARLPRP